jgi:hypothetical protein
MLERALRVPHSDIALGPTARELVRDIWSRVLRLLRALVDFFASGGPLS